MGLESNLERRKLAEIVPQDVFVGTSLILAREDRFLYGIRPAKGEGTQVVLELTGIGGGLENEDLSFSAGVQREALEEIGCRVSLKGCQKSIVVRSREVVERVVIEGPERPAAVVFRYHRTPAHEPWHPANQGEACLIVFLAELMGEPWPTMELPNLVWLPAELVVATAREDVSLEALLASGAELVPPENRGSVGEGVGVTGGLPPMGIARLTDSQEALALALGEEALDFYRTLC